jgi:hypothetical protein
MATECGWVFSDHQPYWYVSISDVSRLSTAGTCVMSGTSWPDSLQFLRKSDLSCFSETAGAAPSYDSEEYFTVQFGHYPCLVSRASWPCLNLKVQRVQET